MSSNLCKVVFLLALYAEWTVAQKMCSKCATPGLRDRWYLTGFTKVPENFSWRESCLTAANSKSSQCDGLCLEMSIVIDNAMQVVRGCYNDFFTEKRASAKAICEFYVGSNSSAIIVGNSQASVGVNAFRLCEPVDQQLPCNGILLSTGGVNGATPGPLDGNMDGLTCNSLTGKALECRSCVKFGEGKCKHNTKTTCKSGAYCTKLKGKAGDIDVEYRGCSPINPYPDAKDSDTCTYMQADISLPLAFNSGLKKSFTGNLCVCGDRDQCNGSHQLSYSTWITSFLGLVAIIPRLL